MNRFDLDHPMYVHMIREPLSRGVPSFEHLRRIYPTSADIVAKAKQDSPRSIQAALDVIEHEPYPPPTWQITTETLDAIRRAGPYFKLFLEIGTFIGRGVLALHNYFAAFGLRCPIVTTDSYGGTLQHIPQPKLLGDAESETRPGFIRYFDRVVLATFLAKQGLGETSFPVQASSRDFFRKFYYLGMQASHIYLDSSHEYLDTYEELRLAWECLEEGGVLAGDDYNWPTVKAAVDRFCAERRLSLKICRGNTIGDITALQWVIAAKNSRERHDDHFHNHHVFI
jgi:Methyltransferase domain